MFDSLHNASSPLLLANVWDVPSAKVAEKAGFSAMGTSSAAVAHMLGYEDGENIPFEELYYIVERIAKSTNLPLSVDLVWCSGHNRC
jgi:2-methylisocitrate lyase-like PEP mutase family enzyme